MATVPEPLVEFVKSCLERGMPRPEIARALEAGGWSAREARAALDAFADLPLPVAVPRKRVSSSPRDAFLHLLAMAMLYTAAIAVGTILFQFIERLLPAPGDALAFGRHGMLRSSAAALLVSLPILAVVHRTIVREMRANPAARITPLYRVLAYLSLLVTSLVMAGDLVCVIVGFLAGDLTLRFVLKGLVVLLLAGGIYLWYSSDMHREEALTDAPGGGAGLPPPPAWREWLFRAGAAVACVSMVAALVAAGSPWRQRLLQLDARRVDALQTIQRNLNVYHQRERGLPDSLDALAATPETFLTDAVDPVTKTPYRYERVDDATYTLTATFDLPSPPDQDRPLWDRDGFFRHGAGEQTFRLAAPKRQPAEP
jgi:hypothetical protein